MREAVTHQPASPHQAASAPAEFQQSHKPRIVDRRARAVAQRKLAEAITKSPRVAAQAARETRLFGNPVQRAAAPTAAPAHQTPHGAEEEDALQLKFAGVAESGAADPGSLPNRTGLPDQLKAGIEALSGVDMSNVRVHTNSDKPAQLNAHAYAQGNDIHLGPGQERHLPHEAWHVVQQAQGRVKPTLQMKDGIPVNDEAGLEHEADVMGARAGQHTELPASGAVHTAAFGDGSAAIVQRKNPLAGQPRTMDLYNAQKTKARFPGGRKQLTFAANIRSQVLGEALASEFSSNLLATTKSGAAAIGAESAQLDHKTPWVDIVDELFQVARELTAKTRAFQPWMADYYVRSGSTYHPTMYAARMYYNDLDNLTPMTGGANASKGGHSGAAATDKVHAMAALLMANLKDRFDEAMGAMQELDAKDLDKPLKTLVLDVQDMLAKHQEDYKSAASTATAAASTATTSSAGPTAAWAAAAAAATASATATAPKPIASASKSTATAAAPKPTASASGSMMDM